jgi:hypothetical protein
MLSAEVKLSQFAPKAMKAGAIMQKLKTQRAVRARPMATTLGLAANNCCQTTHPICYA